MTLETADNPRRSTCPRPSGGRELNEELSVLHPPPAQRWLKRQCATASLGVALSAFAALTGLGCATATVTASGRMATDGRVFVQPPRYPGQELGTGVSLVVEPRIELVLPPAHTFTVHPFYRLDPIDTNRSHADVREAFYRVTTDSFVVSAGVGIFGWGVLEAHRPADVLNQHDFVESLDPNARLGQPYVEAGWIGERSSLKLYYLPWFREQTFPGVRGRMRFPTNVDHEHAEYEPRAGPWHPSAAARYTLAIGDVDLGVSLFTGLSREPAFVLELTSGEVVPRYDLSNQASVSAQWTLDATTLKAEVFVRAWTAQWRPFIGGGVGVDHTVFQLFGESDLSVAAEFFYDSRPVDAPVTFFNQDAFVGARLALNDVSNTELSTGVVVDVVEGATLGRLTLSRRFGEHWRASGSAHVFTGRGGTLQSAFVDDTHLAAEVAYYF